MAHETKSIGFSIGMLGATLCFIYVVFFGVHGDAIKEEVAYLNKIQSIATGSLVAGDDDVSLNTSIGTSGETTAPTIIDISRPLLRAPDTVPGRRFYSAQELFRPEEASLMQDSPILLSGTWQREGYMKSLDAVGLLGQEKYILKNMDNTHFVFLDNYQGSLTDFITAKGGNVVEITDKNAINQHQLFGDTVWFINLPEFKDIKVLMLVFFEDKQDTWFLQIDHDVYYKRKQQLAASFATWYTW